MVEKEISAGDPIVAKQRMQEILSIPSVAISSEAQAITASLIVHFRPESVVHFHRNTQIASKVIPPNCAEDAMHIAIAADQGTEYLLTWNFKHINNAETRSLIAKVIEASGYICPILCSPEELGVFNND